MTCTMMLSMPCALVLLAIQGRVVHSQKKKSKEARCEKEEERGNAGEGRAAKHY